jgi:hypothetical protein
VRRLAWFAAAVLLASCSSAGPGVRPAPLDGYRVVYRIVDVAPGSTDRSTEIVEVRRPYDGRVAVRRDGRTITGRITSREYFWQVGRDDAIEFGVLRPPGGPTRDASFQALLDAVRAGQAIRAGSDTVLRRTCVWFAYRDPAPEPVVPPTDDSRVESCVDASGVVLREVWTLRGSAARILEAIELERVAPKRKRFLEGHDPATEKVTKPKGAELLETQTIVRDIIEGRVSSPFAFEKVKGWRRDRVALVGSTAGQGARPTQFLSRSYVRGTSEVVVVETGSDPQFAPPWRTSEGKRIAIGAGEGRLVFGVDRVEIRVLSKLGFARVIAPSRSIAERFIRGLGA